MLHAVRLDLGTYPGFFGGLVDDIIMRIVDILLAFPGILLAIGEVTFPGIAIIVSTVVCGHTR